ncbi:MAG: hypothetical protein L7F78_01160 [Syntrophales bacterium LBB04]|nr:hypothetical protein [Syntrophales bacterium LBB04]
MGKHFGIAVCAVSLSLLFIVAVLIPNGAWAATKKEINASVDVALQRFAADVKGADEFLKAAKGTLVMPRVKKAGLIIGGSTATEPSGSVERASGTTTWLQALPGSRLARRNSTSSSAS